ncbi:4'-phosphopantetheinyl transferase [Pseudovirgaria hyperparasitica]|uniref:holo-[acyl-carrier-protein] synthase n=1 Tax=Pseudovirgaria hyperparasitica TaxID=470096 RepID=A0A6A6W6Y0_9PEZI|nr:4'-phosphopantetheinyl transferase [Pseudovirgaria hyperparasitica]KAF2757720.1 4'-phosphopantetheinyl transferase [Pseudovirgaria hyperparasitica]
MASTGRDRVTCWLLDTRSIWPGTNIAEAASDELDLVSQAEQDDIKKKFRIQDARMSLGSALLKRLFVAKSLGIPWSKIKFSRKGDPKHGKPCYIADDGINAIEFNISHQAGLVALVGCDIQDLQLGVDIVCVNERDEYRTINSEGFEGHTEIFQDIFSSDETHDMTYKADTFQLPDGTEITPSMLGPDERCTKPHRQLSAEIQTGEKKRFDSKLLIDAKLRRFYTFWCYKEAYIKLTGEALLASWLKQLEFKNVRAPRSAAHEPWGEIVKDAETWLHGKKLDDVALQIQAFEKNFMISVAAKPSGLLPKEQIPSFTTLHLENDIVDFAQNA